MVILTTRHRISDDSHTVNGTTTLSDGTVLNGSYPVYTRYADMHDNVNRKVRGKYLKASNCISVSHQVLTKEFGSGLVGDGRSYSTSNTPFPMIPFDVNNLLPVVPDSLWEGLCLEAFNEFSTQIPTEVSIANFTWELREIGELIPKISNSFLQSVSGGFLNFSFGWKPFVRDLQKLGSLFNTVNSKIDYLVATYGKQVRLGFYRGRVIDDVIPLPTLATVGGNPYCAIGVVGHRADFRAGGRLYHELRGLKTISGDIRAFISALGLNNPVKAIWDAIPFSFIAGWFTRIGTHLNTLAVNPFKGRWDVTNLSFSLTERIVLYAFKNEPLQSIFMMDMGRIEVKRYTRLDGFPIGVSSFNLEDLNPSQLTLLAALTVGRYH
jgi:hypothetical protein